MGSFYHEVTVWTRGIIMDKEARDVANCLALAAGKEGRFTQYISDYVDTPDRTNCLVRKYARISDAPIEDRMIYENPHPNIVVLIEETLVKAVNFFRGTPDGEGVLVVNTARDPEYVLKHVIDLEQKLKLLVCVDAVGLAEKVGGSPWMYVNSLYNLAYDRMSTEGASEKRHVGIGIAAPLIGAVVKATGVVSVDSMQAVVHDVDAARRGYDSVKILDYAGRKAAV